MRTIRFRGKRIDNSEWIYGNLVEQYTHESNYQKVGFAIEVKEENAFRAHDVYPETVGQLTCMAGKDAKLIWEGDLIRINDSDAFRSKDNPENIGVVTWGRGNYFSNGTYCEYNIFAWLYSIEVVGNIHDNSELLPTKRHLKSEAYINGEFFCAEKESGIPHQCCKQCFACKRKEEADNADLNIEAEESKGE